MPELAHLVPNPALLARTRRRSDRAIGATGPVVLWLQRAQRAYDNPALDLAISLGNRLGAPVLAFLAPRPDFPLAQLRHYAFMVQGFAGLQRDLAARGVPLVLRAPPQTSLTQFCREVGARAVVGDEYPLEFSEKWRVAAGQRLPVALWTVEADLVVPSRALPAGEFWAAHTLRPKIARQLAQWLEPQPEPVAQVPWAGPLPRSEDPQDVQGFLTRMGPLPSLAGAVNLPGGRDAGLRRLQPWTDGGLANYMELRDDPSQDGTSMLSPYLHFGQLGPREVARAALSAEAPEAARLGFVEQLVVRRELAWHFVAGNPHYATLQGCENWAKKTLAEHLGDRRPYQYSYAQLEAAQTHDTAWNAAQLQMVRTGWMHNRMRMYWAKQLLLWTADPEQAFAFALQLNDTYQLDGRDPNGYTGIAWSIGGKHDRPWPPHKPVWGLIRPMVASGLAKKFNVELYARQQGTARQPGLL